MTLLTRWLRNFFGFSRQQSIGFLILLPAVVMLTLYTPLLKLWKGSQDADIYADVARLDSLVSTWEPHSIAASTTMAKRKDDPHLFYFNPNTVTELELNQLGFSAVLASRILKYRRKGGRFTIQSDLLKIYGMNTAFYERLYTHIQLPAKEIVKHTSINSNNQIKKKEFVKFDLNTADTVALKAIDGIGTTLAGRIIKYRDLLGGFTNVGQLNEVYGLDSTVIANLVTQSYLDENYKLVKLNINGLSQKELEAHPYINRMIAKAIVTYRFQHGKFPSVEEIRKLHIVKKDIADKIIPYLTLE